MKTVVIGGGVIGVTTAYYLAKEGHDVVVIEKENALGTDATAGNAGLIAPTHSYAWASPQAPKMLAKSLMGQATAIRVKPRLSPRFLWWGIQFLRECTPGRAQENTVVKLKLARYSQSELYRLVGNENIDCELVTNGAVYLHRSSDDLEVGLQKLGLLAEHGLTIRNLTPGDLESLDPAYGRVATMVAGAVHGVDDSSGNSEKFTRELARVCEEKYGVEFQLGVGARRFVQSNGVVAAVDTTHGSVNADVFVVALGIMSPFLSRTIGQYLPIYPAKGFSITAEVEDESAAPKVGGVDEETLVAWSRFGNKLRVSSTAQFEGYSRKYKRSDFDDIFRTAKELFPGAAAWEAAEMRSCMRPMTPDGPPIVGRGGRNPNVYYNTGHGHMGWTMACGSSKLLSDAINRRLTALNMSPFAVRTRRSFL